MSYDAGSITAKLEIDLSAFDRDLARAKAKPAGLTKDRKIRVSAVFDTASLSKARKMFADLDNMISRDAAQRLKSSPQGSVLGTLNSLFSPHPVTGAPSPQQSAQSGLLGKMITQQGGGGPGNTQSANTVRNLVAGQQPGNVSTEDQIKQVLTGQGASDQNTTDKIKQVLTGAGPGNVNTTDTIKRLVTGAAPGDVTTKDTVKEAIDPASKAAVIAGSADTGDKAGRSFSSMFTSHVAGIFDAFKKQAGSSGSSGGASMGKGLLSGIGPGILGISAKMTGIVAGIGTVMGGLPALLGVAGVGMGVAMIGGLVAGVVKSSPALTAQLKSLAGPAKAALADIGKPIIPALHAAFAQLPALLKSVVGPLTAVMKEVAPQIAGVFAGLGPILKGLIGIMQAAAPAFGPFIRALEGLVANILPGIQMVIKATVPFISQFAGILAKLGSNLGGLFAAAAPAIGASMKVLGALLGVIGGLLPVIVKLADVFATALAPVITDIASVIKSFTPILVIVGQVIAALAQAVIGDLVSAFGALATLLTGIEPSLNILAKALEQVFTVLENTGVFAELGDALEALATPLANLINALVKALAPALPGIIGGVGQLAAAFTSGMVVIIGGVAAGLTAIVKAIPPSVLTPVVEGLVALFAVFKTYKMIESAVLALAKVREAIFGIDVAAAANPIGLVVAAIIALGAAFYLAWEKSAGFRNVMKDIASGFLAAGVIIVQAAQSIADAVLGAFGSILHGAVDAFGWIPGIGGKLKAASAAFDGFKGSVDDAFAKTIATMQGWQQELSASAATAKTDLGGIETAFSTQSKAAADAKTALDAYTASVTNNGAQSAAAQAARAQLITDLTGAGVNATTANTDVTNYSTAIAQNGVDSTQAQAARQQLITDILGASNNARTGTTDLGNYTTAVRQNGADSDAARGARAKLISDLEAAGVNAHTATGLVDGLGQSVKDLPAGKNINIDVTGQGTWTITGLAALLGGNPGKGGILPTPSGHQHGGKVGGGYGGGDSVLIAVEPGETILPKEATSDPMTVAVAKKYGVPGFASGGIAGLPAMITGSYDNTQSAMVKSMQQALIAAITKAAAAAAAAAMSSAAAGVAGGGVHQWTGLVLQALKMLGLPASLLNDVLYQMQTESGGNAAAINLTDINAQEGHPSKGLMQVIQGTFDAYHVPGTSNNIYDPLANIAAALNYAAHNAGFGSGPGQIGSGHGYAQGGPILEPVIGFGQNSGQRYTFGEAGPEWVTPMNGGPGVPGQAGGSRMEALLERLIEVTGSLPHGITGGMGAALSGAAQSASFRTRYPRGGA